MALVQWCCGAFYFLLHHSYSLAHAENDASAEFQRVLVENPSF